MEKMKRVLTLIMNALMVLVLAGVVFIGGIYAYERVLPMLRNHEDYETASPQIQPPQPPASETPQPLKAPQEQPKTDAKPESKSKAQTSAPVNVPEPKNLAMDQKEKEVLKLTAPSDQPFPKGEPQKYDRVKVLDFARLMRESNPGKVISKYVDDYKKIMDTGIAKLTAGAANAQKNGQWGLYASFQDDKRYLQSRKDKVSQSAGDYLRSIVRSFLANKHLYNDAIIVDTEHAFNFIAADDITADMINYLAPITPRMPELPKIDIKTAAGQPAPATPVPAQVTPPTPPAKPETPVRRGLRRK